MEMIPLTATARDGAAKPKAMRRGGQVPCVVYGHETKTMTIACEEKILHRVFARAGESTIVELDIEGKKIPVLFKDVSFDPVSGRELHADFYAVNMKEEIETQVPVNFEGESPAVKDLGGIFVVTQEHVTVRCLPADLPHALSVDISGMAEFHSSVSVKDLKLPKDVTVTDEPDTVVATIQEPRKEEEIAPPPAAAGAVPAEGAAPAEGAPAAEGGAPAAAPAEGPERSRGAAEKGGKEKK